MRSETSGTIRSLGSLGFIGAGAVASTLGRLFAGIGIPVVAVTSRAPENAAKLANEIVGCEALATPSEVAARSQTVFLAVPDDAIEELAASIRWQAGQAVIHLSGAKGMDALAGAAGRGARIAALHPLMTFPRTLLVQSLPGLRARLVGCTWALEAADQDLSAALEALVRMLDGHVIRLTAEDRVSYHLAAVLASNYVVTLLGAAVRLWQGFDAPPGDALSALLPLLRAAVQNLETVGLPAAITGPVARGDAGTVERHLRWLEAQAGDAQLAALREAYIALAQLAVPLAVEKGSLTPEAAAAIEELLRANR
jgi:predicted short-subunit dehydrogenase-like oxidoreductase (DUF2520 family)